MREYVCQFTTFWLQGGVCLSVCSVCILLKCVCVCMFLVCVMCRWSSMSVLACVFVLNVCVSVDEFVDIVC